MRALREDSLDVILKVQTILGPRAEQGKLNIILLDEFFGKERFQREKFKAAIEATIERLKQQPAAEKGEKR